MILHTSSNGGVSFSLRGTRIERSVSVELSQLQSDPMCQTPTEEKREDEKQEGAEDLQ